MQVILTPDLKPFFAGYIKCCVKLLTFKNLLCKSYWFIFYYLLRNSSSYLFVFCHTVAHLTSHCSTYFPKKAFMSLLTQISNAWKNKAQVIHTTYLAWKFTILFLLETTIVGNSPRSHGAFEYYAGSKVYKGIYPIIFFLTYVITSIYYTNNIALQCSMYNLFYSFFINL